MYLIRMGNICLKQAEEGSALSTGNYLMEVELPVGQYQFMGGPVHVIHMISLH